MTTAFAITFDDVSIKYGTTPAVEGTTLAIEPGEFFTLLGPSGCGKTTLLRTLAGFLKQSAGHICIGDQVVDDVPPHRRNTAMVFQNYAIFPHLTVRQNIEYGLKVRKLPRDVADERVREALELIKMPDYADRLPSQLSGGQQQRVVIARALVVQPRVLLMDEPLANLDAKLRVALREELRELQRRLGITTLYVTHDQEEALSLSDRVAVMNNGKVMQVGSPREIYDLPTTRTVAEFIGEAFFMPGVLAADTAGQVLTSNFFQGQLRQRPGAGATPPPGPVSIMVRPSEVAMVARADTAVSRPDEATILGRIRSSLYYGSYTRYFIEPEASANYVLAVDQRQDRSVGEFRAGDLVALHISSDTVRVFAGDENA